MNEMIHTAEPKISKTARLWMRRWLILIGVMVYAMILVGGATRLTDSGLSITEWKPISGALPPLSEQHWEELFDMYKGTAEFRLQNFSMDISEFKYIYWWEWGHRLLGRLIGLIAIAGAVVFWSRGWLKHGWAGRFAFLIVLGGLQGAIGWWMVSSGIGETSRVDVAPYRLMTHFCLALLIIGLIAWYWMQLGLSEVSGRWSKWSVALMAFAVVIFIQMGSGALVAGLDAGRTYTDWPLMAGEFVPSGYWMSELGLRNPFENIAAAQFNHRMLAYFIGAVGVLLLIKGALNRREETNSNIAKPRMHTVILGIAILLQIFWGIYTLVHVAPLSLALIHQGIGVIVFILAIRSAFKSWSY